MPGGCYAGAVKAREGLQRALATITGLAQLGERLLCKQEAVGSIPSSSTKVSSKGQRHRAVLTSHHLAIASQQPSTLAIVASAER